MAAQRPLGRRALPVLAGTICVISLMLLIGNLGDLDLGPGTGGARDLVMEMEGMLLPILGAIWVAVLIVFLLTTRKRVPKGGRPQDRASPGFLLGLLLVASIVIIAAALSGNTAMPQGTGPSEPGGLSGGGSQEPVQGPTLSSSAFPFAALLLAAAVVLAAVLALRRGLRPMPTIAAPEPPSTSEKTLTITDAISALEGPSDPRGAILAAYARMAAELGPAGDDGTLTPREFALKTGWRLKESAASLESLTALFEEARYSDHPMGERERSRALAALQDIERELERRSG